jgi:hypothetical protein
MQTRYYSLLLGVPRDAGAPASIVLIGFALLAAVAALT